MPLVGSTMVVGASGGATLRAIFLGSGRLIIMAILVGGPSRIIITSGRAIIAILIVGGGRITPFLVNSRSLAIVFGVACIASRGILVSRSRRILVGVVGHCFSLLVLPRPGFKLVTV